MAKTEVAVKDDQQALPAHLQNYAGGTGVEDTTERSAQVPRIKLLQALSPELDEDESLRQGEWFHDVAGVSIGKEVDFVPCYVTEAFLLWRPQKDGGGILARSNDGVHWSPADSEFKVKLDSGKEVVWKTAKTVAQSRLDQWGTEDPDNPDSPPAATFMINVVCMLPDHPELSPCLMTFQRSGVKIGRKFVGSLKMSTVPAFGRQFVASGKKVDGPSGAYFEPRVKANGFVEDGEAFSKYEEVYKMFKEMGVEAQGDGHEGQADASGEDSSDY